MRSDLVRWRLLLPDLLALDSVLEVDSAEGGDGDPLVGVDPVEPDRALLHSEAAPLFKRPLAEQEVEMLLVKLAHSLVIRKSRWREEGFAANMLDFCVGQVQGGSDPSVGKELPRLARRLRSAVSKQKCSSSELILLRREHLFVLHETFS